MSLHEYQKYKAWQPKFSQQKHNERTCGLHVIAMITHLPYEYIKTVLPKFKGTSYEDIARTLYFLGVDADLQVKPYRGEPLPDLCVLHIRNHWCIWYKGNIWCSNRGVMPFSQYRARVKAYLKVTVPNG